MKQIILLWIVAIIVLPISAQQQDTIPQHIDAVPMVEEVTVVEEAPVVEEADVNDDVDIAIEEAIAESNRTRPEGDTVNVIGKVEVIETPESTRVTLGENEVLIVEENGDTLKVVLGSRGLSIVEGVNGTEIKVMDMDDFPKKSHKKKSKRFRPHFAGLEVGLNNYVTPDFSLVLPPEDDYMDLNTGKSWNWNINVWDIGVGLGTNWVGLASGLGFEFINYNFNGQNSIMKDPVTRDIVEYVPTYAGNITKSKMNITYITIPLLLEFQIPTQSNGKIYISGGVLGSAKLWSNTKIKYTEAGDKSKDKNKSDFNLSPIRWGLTARIGYRWIGLYANYYMTPLFKKTMGPELYPWAMGLAFTF